MQFLYHKEAGKAELELENEAFYHLKARRIKLKDTLKLRNLRDDLLYTYDVIDLQKRSCQLSLINSTRTQKISSDTKLALSVIDPGALEKILPFFNEFGLAELILVYADFSQKNFKLDLKRFERILIQSCEQCGRAEMMKISIFKNTDEFYKKYQEAILLDLEGQSLKEFSFQKNELFFIGAEGGFSQRERALFKRKIKLDHPYILKSQSAALSLLAKLTF